MKKLSELSFFGEEVNAFIQQGGHIKVTVSEVNNRKVILICNPFSHYYSFYCIFDGMNAALASIRDFFQKHLPDLLNDSVYNTFYIIAIVLILLKSYESQAQQVQPENISMTFDFCVFVL